MTFSSSTEKLQEEGHGLLVCQWVCPSAKPLLAKRFLAEQSCPMPLFILQKDKVSQSLILSSTALIPVWKEVPQASSRPFSLQHTLSRYETCCKHRLKHQAMQNAGCPCYSKYKMNCPGLNSLRGFVLSSGQGALSAHINGQAGSAPMFNVWPQAPLTQLPCPECRSWNVRPDSQPLSHLNQEVHIDIWEKTKPNQKTPNKTQKQTQTFTSAPHYFRPGFFK